MPELIIHIVSPRVSYEESIANFVRNVDLVLVFFLLARCCDAFVLVVVRETCHNPQTWVAVSVLERFFLEILQDIEVAVSLQRACRDKCANFFLNLAIFAETLKNC